MIPGTAASWFPEGVSPEGRRVVIYEWYTGSDPSKTVPRRLHELKQDAERLPYKEKLELLQELLEIEKEPNWLGYLLAHIGSEHIKAKRDEEATAAFFAAHDAFDPLLGTIKDVMTEYCATLSRLILDHYAAVNDHPGMAALSMRILTNFDRVEPGELDNTYILWNLGFSLNMLSRKHSVAALRPLAIACYERWHHLQPENGDCLALLAYLYFEEGDFSHSRSAVEMCLQVVPNGEARDEVLKFAREHAAELNLAAGIA